MRIAYIVVVLIILSNPLTVWNLQANSKDINKELDEFFVEFENKFKENGHKNFCRDGLLYRNGNESTLWNKSERRICFLLKDPNADTSGKNVDARTYNNMVGNFGHRLAEWVYGLLKTEKNKKFPFSSAYDKEKKENIFKTAPFAIVNIKKEGGKAQVQDDIVKKFGEKYSDLLRRQLDILKPNIIVCGGNVVFEIAREWIYKKEKYESIRVTNNLFYYPNQKMILINSVHPSSRGKEMQEKYNAIINPFCDFLNSKENYVLE